MGAGRMCDGISDIVHEADFSNARSPQLEHASAGHQQLPGWYPIPAFRLHGIQQKEPGDRSVAPTDRIETGAERKQQTRQQVILS